MPILNDFTDLIFQSFIFYLIFHIFAHFTQKHILKNFATLFLVVFIDLFISNFIKDYYSFSRFLQLSTLILACIIYLFNQIKLKKPIIAAVIIAYAATEIIKSLLSFNGQLFLYWLLAIAIITIVMIPLSARSDSSDKNQTNHFCLLFQFSLTLFTLFILLLFKIKFSYLNDTFLFLKENLFITHLWVAATLLLISFIFRFSLIIKQLFLFLTTILANLIISYFIISTDNFFLFIYLNVIVFLAALTFKNIFTTTLTASYLASSLAILLSLFIPFSLMLHDPVGNLILLLFESLFFISSIIIGLSHFSYLILTKRYNATYQTFYGAICTYSLIIFVLFYFYQPFTNYFNALANINDKDGYSTKNNANQEQSLTYPMENYELTYYWHAQQRHFYCKPNYEVIFRSLPFTPDNFIACLLDETKPENWKYSFSRPVKMTLSQYPFTLKDSDPFIEETKQRITNHILENKEIFLQNNIYSINQLIQWKLHIEQRLTKTIPYDNLILTYRDLYLTNDGYNLAIRAQLRSLTEQPIQYGDCSYPSSIEIIMLFKDIFITEYSATYVLGLTDKAEQCQQIPFSLKY
ncbi:hypothetical protein ACFFHT_02755 [Gallibacterium melopsittaci]|uniref:DUF4401 domain-containing protein n=1 Tax=Gallibacterium melopsittaci TaxID=516063 RepID=A0ABV6HUC8_9PAST